jgi:diaminopimelate epimerase
MRFAKYHALGNDYLVLEPKDRPALCSPKPSARSAIATSDSAPTASSTARSNATTAPSACASLNPDGSEAEKSGNGIRIFCRHLLETKRIKEGQEFRLHTLGGVVRCEVFDGGNRIRVEMGKVSFRAPVIPHVGADREVLGEEITVLGKTFKYWAATVGNPHCATPVDDLTPDLAKTYGPHLETHPDFPNRTNVQFMKIVDRKNVRIEIWERGAGYTMASGSSSSASAAVARKWAWLTRI